MFLNLQKKLTPFFESLKMEKEKIILTTSWWADSMMIASQILFFYWKNEFNLNNIHIAHCNHKIRSESDKEAKFLSDFFSGLHFHLFEREKDWKDDENSLRKWRYSQFSSLQKKIWASLIFLGHHLNDRVESTFLHFMRWAWLNWFLNMRELENHHLLPNECKVCRPLLSISKSEILDTCKETWIPFFEDKTNFDNSVSRRNRIRNQILNPLSNNSKFLESLAGIYKQLENIESSNSSKDLKSMPIFPLWNAEFSFLWNNNILNCNENDIFSLFKNFGIQISSAIINEWKLRMNSWKNGYKYIWGIYFFIHEKQLFIIKAEKEFWKRKNNFDENIELKIELLNEIRFFGFDLKIPRDELIGWNVRLPKNWDEFAWKSRHRRTLNQKIPMWWRDWIPLAIKDRKVIHMWKNIWK